MPESKARILIVDDDDIILDSLQEFLRLEGYHVDVARTYEEAVTALERADFNVVITDVNMPGSTASSCCGSASSSSPRPWSS